MTRLLELRIVRWEFKLLYVIGVFVVGYAVAAVLRAVGADAATLVSSPVIDITGVLYGARVFRVREEPLQPPRARWRMTGRPALSFRLGIMFIVFAAVLLIGSVLRVVGVTPSTPIDIASAIIVTLENALFGWLYLNSGIRLRRAGVTAAPKFRTPAKLV
jgi:hypothetical protein